MRILHSDDVGSHKAGQDFALLTSEKFEELTRGRSFWYDERERIFCDLDFQWMDLLALYGEDVLSTKVLDLGCGSQTGTADARLTGFGRYEPWFCRFLNLVGMEVMGVDVGDLSREIFPNMQKDLLKPGALDDLPFNYYDHVHAHLLFNSPELERRVTGEAKKNVSVESGKRLRDILMPQVERVLTPGGVFLYVAPKEIFQDLLYQEVMLKYLTPTN